MEDKDKNKQINGKYQNWEIVDLYKLRDHYYKRIKRINKRIDQIQKECKHEFELLGSSKEYDVQKCFVCRYEK